MTENLRCDKCGVEYMSIHYTTNHYRRIAAGMSCIEAWMFKPCDGTLKPVNDEKENVNE